MSGEKSNINNTSKIIAVIFFGIAAFIALSMAITSSLSHQKKPESYLTSVEQSMLDVYFDDHSAEGYQFTLAALEKRRSKGNPYVNKIPFCDVLDVLEIEERPDRSSMETGHAISKQWEEIHKRSLNASCSEIKNKIVKLENAKLKEKQESQRIEDDIANELDNELTHVEKIMLEKYYNNVQNDSYIDMINSLREKRSETSPYTNSVPFCDVLDILKVEEVDMDSEYRLSKQWEISHGETIKYGCEKFSKEKTMAELHALITDTEKLMLKKYYSEHSANGYHITVKNIFEKRSGTEPYVSKVPFCDVLEALTIEESPERASVKNGFALSKQWERIKEETLKESCAKVF